jgi:3-hydroxyacyl-[acyl-carrier-protein] dehydratase
VNKQEIKKYLHHREPYLMVSSISAIDQESVIAQKSFSDEDHFIDGHFPNAPVVPGAMLQEFCTQSAGVLITKYFSPVAEYDSEKTQGWALGVLKKVSSARFLGIVKPDNPIQCEVKLESHMDNIFKFKACVFQNNAIKAKINFTLVNISDELIK